MKFNSKALAHALVDVCAGLAADKIAAMCDAAIEVLGRNHAPAQDRRRLIDAVRLALGKNQPPEVHISTPETTHKDLTGLESALKQALGAAVTFEQHADSTLIGGALVTVGDDRYDGSVRGALSRLERQLTSA